MSGKLLRPAAVRAPVNDPDFQALKSVVVERTGHHYYADKDEQFFEHVARRMAEAGAGTLAGYRARLDDPAAGPAEWRALESAITINETFFFRFAEQFEVLRRHVLPRLLRDRATERRLRIWSVGCSTGAEAHSVAILVRDQLEARIADWRVGILGTDIDDAAIAVAREASFSAWTLRTLGEQERQRLFDREGDRWRLKTRYRGLARFEHGNMMALLDGSAPLQFSNFDVILCRNVLIYFRLDVATKLVAALVERLAPDGLLFVGHAEPNPEFETVASPLLIDGVLAYRRRDAPAIRPPARTPVVAPAPPVATRTRPQPPAPAPLPAQPVAPEAAADEVREALSRGDAEEALRLAEHETALTPRDPVPHYLAALGALALGDGARAERGFRNALYLDSSFAMAHYLLGRQLLADGRTPDGERALRNAARVAATLPPEVFLMEGDGMTAAALLAAVRASVGGAA